MSDFERINVNLIGAELKFSAELFETLAAQSDPADDSSGFYRWQVTARHLRDAAQNRCRTFAIVILDEDLTELVSAFRHLADYVDEFGPTPEAKAFAGLLVFREPEDLRARAAGFEALLKSEAAQ